MSDDDLLARTKSLLSSFRALGLEQIEIYKKLNPGSVKRTVIGGQVMGQINEIFMPMEDVARRVEAMEDVFIFKLLDGFWNYYLLNTEYLESPARQGIDRTLLEICYQRLLPLATVSREERMRKLLITSICDVGMILAAPSRQDFPMVPKYVADYDFWVSQLSSDADRKWFEKLKAEDYPTHAFASTMHKLWPSFKDAYTANKDKLIFPWAGSSDKERDRARESFLRMYHHQHDFVHGSHLSVLTAVSSMRTRKHLYASSMISAQAGYQVLHLVNSSFLGDGGLNLEGVLQETGKIIPLLAKRYSHIRVSP